MKYNELQQKSESDLQKLLADTRSELQKTQFAVAHNQETHVRKVRQLKQQVARILTALNNKVQ